MATGGGGSMWLPLLGLLLAPSEAEWTARLHNGGTAAAVGTARAARVAQPGPPLPALRSVFLWGVLVAAASASHEALVDEMTQTRRERMSCARCVALEPLAYTNRLWLCIVSGTCRSLSHPTSSSHQHLP